MSTENASTVDVALIGGGIMSATVASLLQQLRPDWSISLYERENAVATESSGDWNNSGTGHAGLCELNYTPQKANGEIATSKAHLVHGQFRESLGYWAHLVEQGKISSPDEFISAVPHISYVAGADDVDFLRKRHAALSVSSAFQSLEYSEDIDQLKAWAPLMFEGRTVDRTTAMTRSAAGTDVNFGALTRKLIDHAQQSGLEIHLRTEVRGLERNKSGWRLKVRDLNTSATKLIDARFVFVGAGGAALHLLQKSGIPEARGYGGFPVSGNFLNCTNPDVVGRHEAKVYGKPQLNAPPMSMPHLDTRWVNGERVLLFGPFAGFQPRFLKKGSMWDLAKSIKPSNLKTYLTVGLDEFGLTKYLVGQLMLRHSDRMDVLRDFMPMAENAEWTLADAGMRVQTLKPGPNGRGKLEFGTEVVAASDGSIAGLLGASPGASASVSIALHILETCFPQDVARAMDHEFGSIFPARRAPFTESDDAIADTEARLARTLGILPAQV